MFFPTWHVNKMAAGSVNSIAKKKRAFFEYRLPLLHNKWT